MKNIYKFLFFSPEELTNPKMKKLIQEMITLKFEIQKYKDFIKISPLEFELVQIVFRGEFVDKSKYGNITTFKGEVGKIRGKKLIIEDEKI
jgi:hypothetical protein